MFSHYTRSLLFLLFFAIIILLTNHNIVVVIGNNKIITNNNNYHQHQHRSLFIFHTGSYNNSGHLNESVWHNYPWENVHTILMFSLHPELAEYARSVGANVAISTGAPSDIKNATTRRQSIENAINNCKIFKFCNSINLDIERKAENNSNISHELTVFVQELAQAIEEAGEKYLLIYDAAATPGYEGRYYDYKGLNNAGIDFFFVMDYDLNDYNDPPPWNDHSMANSPAPAVAHGLQKLLEFIPAKKIVVGLPFYGYEYLGFFGKLPIISRQLGIHEISSMLIDPSWSHHFDNQSRTPYLIHGKGFTMKQIWYDDPTSIMEKIKIATQLGIIYSGCWTGDALDYSTNAPIPASDFWNALLVQ